MIYPFRCPSCGTETELSCLIAEYDAKAEQMVCGCGTKMKRIYGAPGLVFQGAGWGDRERKWKKEDKEIMEAKRKTRELRKKDPSAENQIITLDEAKKLP